MALIGIGGLAAAGGAHILRGLREAEHHHAHLDALAELREGEDGGRTDQLSSGITHMTILKIHHFSWEDPLFLWSFEK